MRRTSVQVGLIFLAVFFVYFPSINGELITGDDFDLFARLEHVNAWYPVELFVRSASKLLYYRPFLILSYHFDKLIWDLNIAIMHVENIALHAICAILVLFLTRFLIPSDRQGTSLLPLSAAFLFAMHPLTNESVNWISGRTDLIAGVFVLLSALYFLKYREEPSVLRVIAALLFFVFAVFSKEIAVAFFPGILVLLFSKQQKQNQFNYTMIFKTENGKSFFWVSALITIVFSAFLMVRFIAHSSSGRIGLTLKIILNDVWYSTFVCLRGVGFYFKKLFYPWPLNFAILEVDPLYELLGLPVVVFVLYLLFRRKLGGAFIVTGAFLVTPSFLLMFNQIAWTPYAERYLYIPLAFFLPPVVVWLGDRAASYFRILVSVGGVIIIILFFVSSYDRSLVWSTNLSLWGDTMRKSPHSLAAKNEYAFALYNLGRVKESILFFRKASRSSRGVGYNPRYGVNLGIALMEDGQLESAREAFMRVLEITKFKNQKAIDGLKELNDKVEENTSLHVN